MTGLQVSPSEVAGIAGQLQGSNGWIVLAIAGIALAGFLLWFVMKIMASGMNRGFEMLNETLKKINNEQVERDRKSADERTRAHDSLAEAFNNIAEATRNHDSEIKVLHDARLQHGDTLKEHDRRIAKVENRLEK